MKRRSARAALACAAAAALLAVAPQNAHRRTGTFLLQVPSGPFVSGSKLSIQTQGAPDAVAFSLLGPGALDGSTYLAPDVSSSTSATLIAAHQGALAVRTIDLVPPPGRTHALIAVATYDNGIALHDPRSFALLGYAPIGGPPGDVAIDARGDIFAPDTDGTSLSAFMRAPWRLRTTPGVVSGNEVAVDSRTGAVFVTDRDVNGKGALTRIGPDGSVTRTITGETAEGIAIDAARGLVYAGNVNDATVAEIDARTMRVVRKLHSVERTFGIALDPRARRLYVVSNTSPAMRRGGGYVAAIDLRKRGAPIVAKSGNLTFPLGAALDAGAHRLFVTDEASDVVYVLDARTLRRAHAPLRTCRTPWRPSISAGRLYVPCARANRVDVFDLHSLRRVPGAPFATGGFPLGVAVWH